MIFTKKEIEDTLKYIDKFEFSCKKYATIEISEWESNQGVDLVLDCTIYSLTYKRIFSMYILSNMLTEKEHRKNTQIEIQYK